MVAPRRLTALLIGLAAAGVLAGAAAYARHATSQSTPPSDGQSCTGGSASPALATTRLSDAEQAAALAIVRADPLVTAVAGPEDLAVIEGRNNPPRTPGITWVPQAFPLHGTQVGPIVMVHVQLSRPIGPGTHRWRTFGAKLRDECDPNSTQSAWTEVQNAGAGGASELYVTVSLTHKRTLDVTPIPADSLHPTGERDYIVGNA